MSGKVFRHYKGGLYTVLFEAQDATNRADRDEMVVYVSHTTGKIYCRLNVEFFDLAEVNGKYVKRFERVVA